MDFLKITPNEIHLLPPLAVKFLEDAIKRTPGSTSKPEIFWELVKKGYGNIYLIYDGIILMGATYLLVHDTDKGKVVGVVLLGGRKLKKWNNAYVNFVREFQLMVGAISVRSIARLGWGKVFPCKQIGGIFEVDLR